MGESISHALREALLLMHSADRHLRSELRLSICNTTVAGSQPCCVAGVEEAATPGQPVARRSALLEIPPSHSPSRIAGHRRLCRNALAGHAERLARCQHCAPAPVFASSKNPVPFVKKLWMPAIPCGSSWKIRPVLSVHLRKWHSPKLANFFAEQVCQFFLTPLSDNDARS